jgi:prepilin peptidase CpaA
MQATMWWPNITVLVIVSDIDLRTRRIPNWLAAPFLLSGSVVQWMIYALSGLGRSLAGVGLAVLLFGAPCFFRAMGVGDFKLAAGVAAWIGPCQLSVAATLTAIVGGIIAVCYAAWRGSLATSLDRAGDLVRLRARPLPAMGSEAKKSQSIPYAPAIAIGTLLLFLAR